MTLPTTTGNTIISADFNYIQSIVEEVMGQGENGYGMSDISSIPVSEYNKVGIKEWQALSRDLGIILKHITNYTTSSGISGITTGTLIIAKSHNIAASGAEYALANRYECHPAQYFLDPVTGNSVVYSTSSSRTAAWGIEVREVHHSVRVSFPTRLIARYFFNLGSYVQWFAGDENNGLNDIDGEWANFFDYINTAKIYTYSRNQYTNYNSTMTVYNSGTLQVQIIATIVGSISDPEYGNAIDFNFYYLNLDSALLVVSPAVSYWEILI
jgi:hypothetical protein